MNLINLRDKEYEFTLKLCFDQDQQHQQDCE